MIALAALLAGTAVFFWLRRDSTPRDGVVADAATIVMTPVDAGPEPVDPRADARPAGRIDAGRSANVDAGVAAFDAGTTVARIDAGATPSRTDAGTAAVDPSKQAKTLYQDAGEAIQEGDFAKALELADQSLALRSTARGHLVRAQALQRLGRIDEALRSVDSAQSLASSYATVYEVRGNILWAARRWDAAHDAYNKFLELEQDTPRAEQIRRRIEEPR